MMETDTARFRRLRWYNGIMQLVHAAQGVAILALSNDFALSVSATFMEGPPGTPLVLTELFSVAIGRAVAAFVFLSAAAHWILVLSGVFGWYRANLARNRNYARWMEYSISSSLMVVLIAILTGIADVAALVAIFGATPA